MLYDLSGLCGLEFLKSDDEFLFDLGEEGALLGDMEGAKVVKTVLDVHYSLFLNIIAT